VSSYLLQAISFGGFMRLKGSFLLLLIFFTLTIRALGQCVAVITPSSAVPCSGTSDTLFASYAAGNSYQWLYSATPTGTYTTISGATSQTYITTLTGYYKVNIKNGTTCNVTSNYYSLNFDQLPTPVISLSGNDSICPGQTVVISANSGNQITYQWVRDGVNMAGLTGTSILAGSGGNYWVVEADLNGCSSSSASIAIVQRQAPTPLLTPTGPVVVCDSLSTLLSTTPYSNAIYNWYKFTSGSYTPIAGVTSNTYTATASGIYEVTAVYNNGCSETSVPLPVTFATTPAKPVVTTNSPVCLSYNLNCIVTNPVAGYTYSWTGAGGFVAATQNISTPMGSPIDSGLYIVNVSNKGCLNADTVHVIVSCLDSVWPGDVNADHVVDNNDALDLALGFNYTSYARTSISNVFAGQFCADWSGEILPGVNMKHGDCNGSGGIDSNDLAAIYANYGDMHSKTPVAPLAKTTGLPDLYFDLTNYPNFYPGETVSVPINLGDLNNKVYNIMGIAADIKISGLVLSTPPTITYPTSWLGAQSNTLRFAKLTNNGNTTVNNIGWAYARTDHNNISGEGTIANLNFVVPQGIGYNSWAFLYFDNVTIIDNDGNALTGYNVINDTTVTNPTSISNTTQTVTGSFAVVAPNPSPTGGQCYLQTNLSLAATISISITDVTGRSVWEQTMDGQGKQNTPLPSSINPGIYFIQVQRSNDNYIQTLKWLKN